MAQGSARSIRGFHVVEALDTASELLVKYGGHPMAAGFTLAAEKIEALSLRLNRYAAERLRDEDLGRALTADAELELDQAGLATVRALRRLEPHGIGNPAPLLLLRRVPLRAVATLKDKHLKLRVGAPPHLLDALWWEAVKYQPQLAGARQVSLMCRLEINVWKGLESAQLKVEDLALE
jgi:single-stranded-DNA-specific exonuclease